MIKSLVKPRSHSSKKWLNDFSKSLKVLVL